MSAKPATVTLDGKHLRFVGRTGSRHRLVIDDRGGDTGPGPSELIPLALAGDVEAVRRAIELSATRHCAVGSTLATGVTEIHHAYVVIDEHGDFHTGEMVVLGPLGRVEVMAPVATA